MVGARRQAVDAEDAAVVGPGAEPAARPLETPAAVPELVAQDADADPDGRSPNGSRTVPVTTAPRGSTKLTSSNVSPALTSTRVPRSKARRWP